MNLLTTEQVYWTVPVSQQARKLLRELEKLGQNDGPEATRRKGEILSQLPRLVRFRFTLKSVTVYDENARDRMLKSEREAFEKDYGITPGNFVQWYFDTFGAKIKSEVEYEAGEKLSKDEAAEIFAEVQDTANWATVYVCLHKIEEGEGPLHEPDTVTWKDSEIPKSWRSYSDFMKEVPRPLFDALIVASNALNPGVWRVGMDDEAKNFGGVSASL